MYLESFDFIVSNKNNVIINVHNSCVKENHLTIFVKEKPTHSSQCNPLIEFD